ncbi:hypothetical protein ILUMI_26606 [Ignelater luminosus]|uniref:Piwi n=1 Tax=Ignelater luminosus TaxID=2038154 RepID=A0A8K0C682_IGNLU|nr:hypothetical protein ILUMI_26606 [Ignelater luminosus]
MADQQRGRGRARGRARGGAGDSAPQQRPGGQQPQRGPPPRGPPGGGGAPVQPSAWGPRGQTAPSVPSSMISAGRATQRGMATSDYPGQPTSLISSESSEGAGRGNGNGATSKNGGSMRRGNMRGRRKLHEMTVLRTRPDNLQTKQGTFGTPVRLSANYFKLLQQTNWCLYQYRVDVAPEEDRTIVKKALFRRAAAGNNIAGYIFDGTVLYTSNRLNPDPLEIFAQDDRTNENYRFTIRLVGDVAAGDYQYIQFFNIIMRKCLGHLRLQLVGRNFFDAIAKVSVPDHRMELWPGYITSIRQHENAILMCAEITHKVMRHDTVLQLLGECLQQDRAKFKKLFQDSIIGSVVLTEYNNRTYHIDDVDFNTNPNSTFSKRDGTSISYRQYFRERYNLNITNNEQPMLVSRAKQREIRAGMAETVYLVPELCRMTGLTDQQRANFSLMKALAEHTRMAPGPRIKKLLQFSNRLCEHPDIVRDLREWNLELAQRLVDLPGRILPPEKVFGGGGSEYSAGKDADWTRELRSRPMVHTAALSQWVVICPNRLRNSAQSFVQTLQKACKGMQWNIPFPKLQEIRDDKPGSYLEGLEAAINNYNPQLVMCIATNNKQDRYAAIKKKCYVDRAVPCQVILAKNLESKGVMSIATKVAIQLNCKLGGAPWSVPLPYKNMMVIGYDVCHDTNHKERSYGALVATLNSECGRYFSTVTAHTSGEELSNDFSLNVIKACKKSKEVNGILPDKIMIYRDGVGDGQLVYVLELEVKAIRERLAELYGGEDKVKLCFIVVSKRINTRVFYNEQNPPPGTVVDDIITLPERYDFFIVSQCVRQGTVSPTSYNILFDNMGQSADKLQRLTYKLTHMYFNWSGTVRVPAPCQYAHKLAFLVAQYLHRNPHAELENLLYFL